ncbi:MAG TPA: UDP-N-acetylglucosamine acyltransferase [Marmoricola sp.]|nr:UDP-N-acetylglucosamine acyltransferase [Marmoricola sp.]
MSSSYDERFPGNEIHPTAIIDDGVSMGTGNRILPYTVIYGPTDIGNDNVLGPHTVIGTPGQDKHHVHDPSTKRVEIGDGNVIREFTAVQKPVYRDVTRLGNRVYLMQSVHIPHDANIGDDVVITPMVALAGVTAIQRGTNLGMGASVHQYSTIGAFSMVATGAAVVRDLRPFSLFIPGKSLKVNRQGIVRNGFSDAEEEINAYVLEAVRPTSPTVLRLVEAYELARTTHPGRDPRPEVEPG